MHFLKSISKTPLFKISSLNSVSVILKLCIGLVTSKVIAVFIGPGGMALVGNLRNFIASLETISTLGFQNGIIKYTAESEFDKEQLKQLISTVFFCLLLAALLLSGLLFSFSEYWDVMIFGKHSGYEFVIKALAFAMPWYAASLALVAFVNGLGKFKEVIYITVFGNIIGLIISVLMILQYRTLGALLAIVISPSVLFLVSMFYTNREIKLSNYISWRSFSNGLIKKMASYSLMAIVAAVISPLVFLAIRNNLIASEGIEQAGFWEAITRISTYYLMFVLTIIGVYFLPKLAKAKDNTETAAIFRGYYKGVIPVFIMGLLLLFFIRDFVVRLLFTEAFLPIKDLFFWQLLGDTLKACALILGYNLIAKKHTAVFVVTEFVSMAVMYLGSHYLVSIYGIGGIVMAHCLTYAIYLLTLGAYFRKNLSLMFTSGSD